MTQSNAALPRHSLDDLRYLMRRLRDPEHGCPWDLKQSFSTIVPYTLEEVYELVDAIEQGDSEQIRQELGDLLFQVIFYNQLAEEAGDFDLEQVIGGLVEKLVRRHPHVFADGELYGEPVKGSAEDAEDRAATEAKIKSNWEAIKAEERGSKGQAGLMDDIPRALPAMKRAAKLQKRAAGVGFDWDSPLQVQAKLEEELTELAAELVSDDKQRQEDELGDVLFAVVNMARHLSLDPETALRGANRRFEQRFAHIEQGLAAQNVSLDEASLAQMEALWQVAKEHDSK